MGWDNENETNVLKRFSNNQYTILNKGTVPSNQTTTAATHNHNTTATDTVIFY
jgi:hypothetical protein